MRRKTRAAVPPTQADAPHQRPWRYIFIEIVIVTAGLFIALMLNGVVDWVHQKQLVRDARQNIEQELRQNRQIIRKDLPLIRAGIREANSNIAILHGVSEGRINHGKLGLTGGFTTLNDAAWQTARETEALSYMPYDEVQRYSDLYGLIVYVNGRAVNLVGSQSDVLASSQMGYDLQRLPQSELLSMLRGSARSKMEYMNLSQLLTVLDAQLAREASHSAKH